MFQKKYTHRVMYMSCVTSCYNLHSQYIIHVLATLSRGCSNVCGQLSLALLSGASAGRVKQSFAHVRAPNRGNSIGQPGMRHNFAG